MSFFADKQTLEDLNLTGKFKQHSIFSIFNRVKTAGGERLLESMFQQPLTDPEEINKRSAMFFFFQQQQLKFPFNKEGFEIVENYLGAATGGNAVTAMAGMLRKKMMNSFLKDEQYTNLVAGLTASIEALNQLRDLVAKLDDEVSTVIKNILFNKKLNWLADERGAKQLGVSKLAKYDNLLRNELSNEMETLLAALYQLDVFIAVSDVAHERSFTYAKALPASKNVFNATALRHPGLDKAVANPLHLHDQSNVLFLTGANMAGKSTFMKSFGIAVYLAHMGFPVAAGEMEFSVRDGLYSSINVPDNLSQGYSHFYAEVLRVKTVAQEVASGKNMVVIFDELFKGTNVKDAYDATLSCTASFSRYRNCFFIVSTHIIEVGEALRSTENLQFSYLPTVMEGNLPRYTYRLMQGITSDRHGMIIIGNEKILEIIREGSVTVA